MPRPRVQHPAEKLFITFNPLQRAKLDAYVEWQAERFNLNHRKMNRSVVVRQALQLLFEKEPLPDEFFEEFINRMDPKEREKIKYLWEEEKEIQSFSP